MGIEENITKTADILTEAKEALVKSSDLLTALNIELVRLSNLAAYIQKKESLS